MGEEKTVDMKRVAVAMSVMSLIDGISRADTSTEENKVAAVEEQLTNFELMLGIFGYKIVKADDENYSEEVPVLEPLRAL